MKEEGNEGALLGKKSIALAYWERVLNPCDTAVCITPGVGLNIASQCITADKKASFKQQARDFVRLSQVVIRYPGLRANDPLRNSRQGGRHFVPES